MSDLRRERIGYFVGPAKMDHEPAWTTIPLANQRRLFYRLVQENSRVRYSARTDGLYQLENLPGEKAARSGLEAVGSVPGRVH